jgi:amino acid adenylation domain-containing protein
VVQYFPNVEYLREVLRGAVRVLAPGGAIFLGDLRSLPLLKAFHASVELHRAHPALSLEEFRRRVHEKVGEETELVVAPALFQAIREEFPSIDRVQVLPKRESTSNELTRYRYDAILRTARDPEVLGEVSWLGWDRDHFDVQELRRRLEAERPQVLAIAQIPNARVANDVRILDLAASQGLRTVEDLRRALPERPAGVEPSEIWSLGQGDYEVQLSWVESEPEGRFEAIFRRAASAPAPVPAWSVPSREPAPAAARGASANRPLARSSFRELVARLRQRLAATLPDYMIPSAFVWMDSLPLTVNGKLDTRALPPPERSRAAAESAYVPPRTRTEEAVVRIFREVLALDRVGAEDDFFELGGHSLKAAQVISRIRRELGVEVSVRDFFESSTAAGLASLIDGMRESGGANASLPLVARTSSDGEIPLSFAQERLWFFDQLEPGSSAYNISRAVRLRGEVDPAALSLALDGVVARHESLRTVFHSRAGKPYQVILERMRVPLDPVDLSGREAAAAEEEAAGRMAQEAGRPFDLSTGPLLRATLLSVAPRENILLLTMHHIVSDEWSLAVLFRELAGLYATFSSGQPASLPELPIQYPDFAVWQREAQHPAALEASLEYWRRQMDAAPPFLDLPEDRPRPATQSFAADTVSVAVSSEVHRDLGALCRSEGTTLFMTLLAAVNVILSRHAGQEDVVVGSPIVERHRVETEGLIGFFINTLVLRTDLSGDPTFRELLARTRQTALDAYAHEVPFEKLVEALHPKRDLSHTPLFQVFFNMLNFAPVEALVSGVAIEDLEIPQTASRFDLTVYADERQDEIRLTAVYNPDVFARGRIEEMMGQLAGLLPQITARPEEPISSYSLVTSAGRRLLPDPSATIEEPEVGTATSEFLTRAQRTPDAAAIVAGERTWTYQELSESSKAIAQELLGAGAGRGVVVAVSGRRSFGLIAAMLGVLRSGGVLLTLDPALPLERRKLMLAEARARLLLSVGAPDFSRDALAGRLDRPPIEVAEDGGLESGDRGTAAKSRNLAPPSAEDPAYVFFTSGTSGLPKAVLGSHKGLAHFLKWERETFAVGRDDRCAQLTGLSFDVVLRDVFVPLTSGASLHLPGEGEDPGSPGIVSWLEREGITVVHTVPAVAQSWLAAPPADVRLTRLRLALFAGEPLTDVLVRRWFEAFSRATRIVNLYGPTETTLAKCFFIVPHEPPPGIQPVGAPLPQTQALVLGSAGALCGIGEVGEIVVRTPFRTFGYINAPGEQRARFVPNPFRSEPDDLLYRTGDRGRYRLDGSLAILGRLDDQIKIRGVRVEPAEVAAVLSRHPGVGACAVVARKMDSGENALAAYVVASRRDRDMAADLRSHLKALLPSAMVPSAIVFLDSLPLTANGKLDRAALPAPDFSSALRERALVLPRTPIEEIVASIWSSVLGIETIGVSDDFFELGGHSLKATQVISRLGEAFALRLPVRLLFETPTLEGLSSAIESILVDELQGPDWEGSSPEEPAPSISGDRKTDNG